MSADLEHSYRRALAWYPRSWRERNADVMVGTLLDVAEAEHRARPRRAELVGLAASGLSARFGTFLEPSARNAISTIALATGVAYPLAYFAFQLWSPWSMEHAPDSAAFGLRPVINPGLFIAAVWLIALAIALFVPRQRGLKPTIATTIVASIALSLVYRVPGIGNQWYGLMTTSMVLLAALGVLVLIGTPARGMRLAIPTAVAFAAITGGYLAAQLSIQGLYFDERYFWVTISGPLITLLGCATLAAVMFGITRRTTIAQTIAVSIAPWIATLLIRFLAYDPWNGLALIGIGAALVGFGAALSAAFQHTSTVRREDFTRL